MLVRNKSARLHVLNLGEHGGMHTLAPIDAPHDVAGKETVIRAAVEASGGELEIVEVIKPNGGKATR